MRRIASFVHWLRARTGVCVIGGPVDSYVWPLLDQLLPYTTHTHVDTDLTLCMFGAAGRLGTRLRMFGDLRLEPLSRICCRTRQGLACGNALHAQDGYGATAETHKYPGEFLKRLAGLVAAWALSGTGRHRTNPIVEGKVRRHADRGPTAEGIKDRQRAEDRASTAGARSPAALMPTFPMTVEVCGIVRGALLRALRSTRGLRNCHLACGESPARLPPCEADIDVARGEVSAALGLPPDTHRQRHAASPLRHALFGTLVEKTGDSDVHVATWLREGAPSE